jgi:beta-lactam-binding protein with PASTA domain
MSQLVGDIMSEMVDADASTHKARSGSPPPDVVLQMVSSLALTMLGEVLGSSLTGKLLAGALGALLGTFLTAPGSRRKRRIVAVALLLALLDLLRSAADALASTARRETGGDSRGHVGPADWVPRRPLLTLAVGLAGFALGTGATAIAHGFNSSHVPDVIGRDASQAEAILAANGFHAAIHRQRSLYGGDGRILGQSPSPGESEARGSTVVLTVAAESSALVPNVVGLPAHQAIARLERHFDTKLIPVVGTNTTSQVLSQAPRAGAIARIGSVVSLVVSTHRPAPLVPVPHLVGLAVEEAEARLKAIDLSAEQVSEPSEEVRSGVVIDSTPAAGTSVEKGSTVTLKVSSGPPGVTVPAPAGHTAKEGEARLKGITGRSPGSTASCSGCRIKPRNAR